MIEAIEKITILTEAQDQQRRTLAQELGNVMSEEEYLATLPEVLDSRHLIVNLPATKVYQAKADAGLKKVRVW